ncbi:MAG: GLPGLI family protein [Bacteroidetes bacterium]|nr:MAG: GLPGLI family protein [Bacteroidota bacterium]
MYNLRYCCMFFALLLMYSVGSGQKKFISSGKIEFEKKVNVHAMLSNSIWDEQRKSTLPQFQSTFFDLYFTDSQTMYKSGREVQVKYNQWGLQPTEDVLATNLLTGKIAQRKHIFEDVYLITEDLLKIKWKLTNETRTIAGFECKKATGIFNDSLYVFAFYTDEIIVPSGPELFSGLPGLILGVAFPRRHTTWFATKMELNPVSAQQLTPPTKGKKTDRATLLPLIKKGMDGWDENSRQNVLYAAML